jgi:hypothetical protein
MACKNLAKVKRHSPEEVGEGFPQQDYYVDFACKLGRNPGTIGWTKRCKEASERGPCWWWEEEHPGIADPQI